jgi:DNA mismatch endonuclease (patch repair protein)
VDNLTKEKRSKIMGAIHSKDTKPELILRDALSNEGVEFETNFCKHKIDIAFPKQKIAIFVDGCFWHGCPIHSHEIKSNESYWKQKLEKNKQRDKMKTEQLQAQNWTVMRFWEHELVNTKIITNQILKQLKNKEDAID